MLSYLSVSNRPKSRLRHLCASKYLRIPPLHLEFPSSLLFSRSAGADDLPQLICVVSRETSRAACVPFAANNCAQRSPPTYDRRCRDGVSGDFLVKYCQGVSSYVHTCSSLTTEFYVPK